MSSPAPQNTLPTDAELVAQALTDTDKFGFIIERYEAKLLRYILRLSNVYVEEAEEILQESFIKAWRNLRDYDPQLPLSSWLYRITHNEVISHYRKLKSRGSDTAVPLDETIFELASEELGIPEQTDKKILSEHVRAIFERLSEEYRTVLVLKFLEDKSYEEISDIIKKPMGTVATLLNRAKKTFKEKYDSVYA